MAAARERPTGGRRDRFTLAEMNAVLDRFELGPILRASEYPAGSRKSPKLLVESAAGRFILKRRALARHPLPRIRFGQSLQHSLARHGFPVAGLVPLRDSHETLLVTEGNAYELFRFVEGVRFDRSEASCTRAGEALALLHGHLADHPADDLEPASFHRSPTVAIALRSAVDSIAAVDPGVEPAAIERLVRVLATAYDEASVRVDAAGFASLRVVTVHGDFHPGNLLFADGRVAAVLDFDSARREPRVVEVANGMMQFAQPGRRGVSPLEWAPELDPPRLEAFLAGYAAVTGTPVTPGERSMIPWLMIEAMVAESIIPIANTGSFADLPAGPFLASIVRKCGWVRERVAGILGG